MCMYYVVVVCIGSVSFQYVDIFVNATVVWDLLDIRQGSRRVNILPRGTKQNADPSVTLPSGLL